MTAEVAAAIVPDGRVFQCIKRQDTHGPMQERGVERFVVPNLGTGGGGG